MARFELIMPKMGESVAEATIIKWVKNIGDSIDTDEPVLEIATDKVDSEVPSPVAGKLLEQKFKEDDVVQVGEVVAIIDTGEGAPEETEEEEPETGTGEAEEEPVTAIPGVEQLPREDEPAPGISSRSGTGRFYSPLVRSIAEREGLGMDELERIEGTGAEGRVTKNDVLAYLQARESQKEPEPARKAPQPVQLAGVEHMEGDEIIEMDRMRRMIADHMVMSKQVSPHVTSFVEADVTNLVRWREKIKQEFERREGEKITFTPIFIDMASKAIRDFPMINISVDGSKIIRHKNINIGMAAALPTGNLIVPVIKRADQMNLVGLTKTVNDLTLRARENRLQPDEVKGGTFTITNVGTFGNVMGTPIINQPQVAVLAIGAIRKKPAVLETEHGDVIAVRHMMFLSMSYDHRVVDGALGGGFLRRVADYLEDFDVNRTL